MVRAVFRFRLTILRRVLQYRNSLYFSVLLQFTAIDSLQKATLFAYKTLVIRDPPKLGPSCLSLSPGVSDRTEGFDVFAPGDSASAGVSSSNVCYFYGRVERKQLIEVIYISTISILRKPSHTIFICRTLHLCISQLELTEDNSYQTISQVTL
jgi:hypothetical protein